MTIGLLTALVVVVTLGGVGAVAIARHQRENGGPAASHADASRTPAPHTMPAPRSSSTIAASEATRTRRQQLASAGTTTPGPSVAVSTTAGSPTPGVPGTGSDPTTAPPGPSNNLTVQMSPSTRMHPRSQQVQQALQSYFDAINRHDYPSWTQSVTADLAARQSSTQWLQAYATTVDSSIWMQSVRDAQLQVQIRFTSQQDPDLAPTDMKVDCIHWTLTYQMADQDGQLAIGSTVDGSVDYVKC